MKINGNNYSSAEMIIKMMICRYYERVKLIIADSTQHLSERCIIDDYFVIPFHTHTHTHRVTIFTTQNYRVKFDISVSNIIDVRLSLFDHSKIFLYFNNLFNIKRLRYTSN